MGYRGKLEERAQARELRAQGWTMPDIAAKLGVSRSSVSLWTRDVPFTPDIERTLSRRLRARRRGGPNKLQRRKQEEIDHLLAEGTERIGKLSERDFLIAGVALYAGEGSKRDGAVSLANTNAGFIAFFCAWLRQFFEVDETRLRVKLYLHEGLDLHAAITYWARVTAIPPAQFGKPYRAVPDAGIRHSKHLLGCATVSYSCARTHRMIMGLVHALLAGPGYVEWEEDALGASLRQRIPG
ncbi:MAG TPA: helix-turn-helix domain-containing protein [Egibacteraceae bacterium]|nr:helix-turn-helix domain-containing protein [Egibacteraceae bacterium]